MARLSLNYGIVANDGTGDALREAFQKTEYNFIDIYQKVDNISVTWDALQGKPTFATVAYSGSYADLLNKPTFATVASSGSYTDLLNKPTIPSLTGYATETYVNTQISSVINSAPETLNTLSELAQALGSDANFSTSVSTALGNRLRIDINNQGLTAEQKSNALTNIGLGPTDTVYDAENDVYTFSLNTTSNPNTQLTVAAPGDLQLTSGSGKDATLQAGSGTSGGYVFINGGDGASSGGEVKIFGGVGSTSMGGSVTVEAGAGQLFSTAEGGTLFLKAGLNGDAAEGWKGRANVEIEADLIDLKGLTRLQVTTLQPTAPTVGTLALADGTSWNPGNGQGFYAYYNSTWNFIGPAAIPTKDMCLSYLSAQTLAGSGWNKVPIDVTSEDTNLIFNSTSKRIIPKKAGYYSCSAKVMCAGNLLEGLSVYKNGSITVRMGHFVNFSTARAVQGSFTIYCNGTTDYLELFALINGSGYYSGGLTETYLQVFGPL